MDISHISRIMFYIAKVKFIKTIELEL